MKKLLLIALLSTTMVVPVVSAAPKSRTAVAAQPQAAVARAVHNHFHRNYKSHGPVTVQVLGIRGEWALAKAEVTSRKLDPASILLRRRGGRWGVLVLGSSLHGVGKQYGVPRGLWKKWGL